MLNKIFDDLIFYPGYWRKENDAFCHLTVYRDAQTGASVLVASEEKDNAGLSVTNAIERITTLARRQLNLDPDQITVIEHYPAEGRPGSTRPIDAERFAIVEMVSGNRQERTLTLEFIAPGWTHATPADVVEITGDQKWSRNNGEEKHKPDG